MKLKLYKLQKPRQPHYLRARLIALAQPIFPKKEFVRPCIENPLIKKYKEKSENPYEEILAREIKNWFDHSKMIGIVHINSIHGEDFFKAAVEFHKNGMHLKKYGRSLLSRAILGSNYECLLPLNENKSFSTGFIFGTEHNNVTRMLKAIKKTPQMTLLCGVVENKLLSKNEFTNYASLPDIDIVRSQFTNVLNLAASQIVQNLQSHQANLVNILEAHVRENSKEVKKVAKKDNTEDGSES